MTRDQLEHIIRAAGAIVGAREVVVIGSQAILAQFPEAQGLLVESVDADVFTFRDPADAEVIDGSIGERSPFHDAFGMYAHGVGIETATLPGGWRERLVPIDTPATRGVTGLCLEAHDLAASKIAAAREKDVLFVAEMLRRRMIDEATLRARVAACEVPEARREVVGAALESACARAAGRRGPT